MSPPAQPTASEPGTSPASTQPAAARRAEGSRAPRRWVPFVVIAAGLAAVLVAVVAASGGGGGGRRSDPPPAPATALGASSSSGSAVADPVAVDIARQQDTLRADPANYGAWAALGLDYVQQAKVKVDPAYYPKAEGSLARSLKLNGTSNVAGFAGEAALKAAEHDFSAARSWAQRGLAFNAYNPVLYAALDDADTQLGRYTEAFAAADRLNQLHPGVPAFTRAEYVYELRGDIARGEAAMRLALDAADSPADTAFAQYYLGQLAFDRGDAAGSLRLNQAGLAADPSYFDLKKVVGW